MLIPEQTADGSYTLFVPELNEHYHSIKGALNESIHIFISMGLRHSPIEIPRILEIGFGTGLNAFLTLLEANRTQRTVHYTTIERYPVPNQLIDQLHYPENISPNDAGFFHALHSAPWETDIVISPYFTLHKVNADFTHYTLTQQYDIVYFDAFAPEKQPEMWSQDIFNKLYEHLNNNGILTTYCAKGIVRRILQSGGFSVERFPGPPDGKREILRGNKNFMPTNSL